ncbi:hypothetical protein TSAR_011736 [Trichomalopsis sarcophagae]|uniref:Uncharacterized protein n=1 Tax=Trichomalopsis sarcophagae TaxID=543379 RepID=A0A232EIX7_9HYME|nr:hypothetical protein TSAR_011736 [Trichomalopsis sarcophagae]
MHQLSLSTGRMYMPLNYGYFSTNLKGLENSVTRHFFDVGTWFYVVLNMYNKKKSCGSVPQHLSFLVSPTRKWHFSRRISHIRERATKRNREKEKERGSAGIGFGYTIIILRTCISVTAIAKLRNIANDMRPEQRSYDTEHQTTHMHTILTYTFSDPPGIKISRSNAPICPKHKISSYVESVAPVVELYNSNHIRWQSTHEISRPDKSASRSTCML